MTIYAAGRQWGKTTFLIKKSAETGAIIVAPTREMASSILWRANELNLDIPCPISIRQFINQDHPKKDQNYLIDELQSCLNQLQITDATMNIEALGYLTPPVSIMEKLCKPIEEPKQKESYSVAIKTSELFDANYHISRLTSEGILFIENYKNGNADILRTSNGGLIVLTNDLNWFTCGCRFDRMYGYDDVTKRRYTKARIDVDYMEGPLAYILNRERTLEEEKITMNKPKTDPVNSVCRISKKEYYLNIAKAVSQRSTCIRRQYGAVIVKNDEIIATGYNGSARGEANCCDVGTCWREENNIPHGQQYEKCVAVHAEQNALISAPRDKLIGSTIYIYGEENGETIQARPCEICNRMLINAGVTKMVFSEPESKTKIFCCSDERSFIKEAALLLKQYGNCHSWFNMKFDASDPYHCRVEIGNDHANSYKVSVNTFTDIKELDQIVLDDIARGIKTTSKNE